MSFTDDMINLTGTVVTAKVVTDIASSMFNPTKSKQINKTVKAKRVPKQKKGSYNWKKAAMKDVKRLKY